MFAELLELLEFLQNFCRSYVEILELLQNFRRILELLKILFRIFAELLELWESQEFKLDNSWLLIDQFVEKSIKSIKLDKIWETDEKKKDM